MTITYTWKISQLHVKNINDKENFVIQVNWEKSGTDEDGRIGTIYGTSNFTKDSLINIDQFIPFDQLTESIVLDWVKDTINVEIDNNLNENIQNQINDLINPIVNKSLPWLIES